MNTFQQYKYALSTKSELKFRDKEIEEIENFLNFHLKNKKSSSIYISGPSGTGKTACITYILDKIKDKYKFNKLWLNGMSFTNAKSLYKKIFNELTNKETTTKDMIPLIIQALSKPRKPMFILVLDEIDILNNGHQEMIYTIFNLSRCKSTKVIIIGIANTLDFTSKTLIRYHSLNLNKIKEITFAPYDEIKIAGILRNRIGHLIEERKLFDEAAIDFCAKKVASYSGDIRKALEIMRRSIELVEQEINNKSNPLKEQNRFINDSKQNKMVTIMHVIKVVNQVFGDKFVEVNQDDYNFPVQQKLVLCIIVLLSEENKKNLNLGKCYDRFRKIAKDRLLTDIEINNTNLFLDMCEMLETKSFITIQKSKDLRCTKLFLSISVDEAKELLKSNHLCHSILF